MWIPDTSCVVGVWGYRCLGVWGIDLRSLVRFCCQLNVYIGACVAEVLYNGVLCVYKMYDCMASVVYAHVVM